MRSTLLQHAEAWAPRGPGAAGPGSGKSKLKWWPCVPGEMEPDEELDRGCWQEAGKHQVLWPRAQMPSIRTQAGWAPDKGPEPFVGQAKVLSDRHTGPLINWQVTHN